jgi:hypothetical protein
MISKTNVARRSDAEDIDFDYVCECNDCGAEGALSLKVKDGMKPFACPEGCGTTYVPWRNPLNLNRWELKVVVMPVYGTRRAITL